jgi:hypothetical protein
MNKLGFMLSVPWPRPNRMKVVELRLEPMGPEFYKLRSK